MSIREDLQTPRGRRRFIIRMCQRRQRPGSGSDLRGLMGRAPRTRWPDLTGVLGAIPWAVVGAVATRLYMPERSTQRLDVMVVAHDVVQVHGRLRGVEWQPEGRRLSGRSAWRSPEGVQVDVLACDERWAGEALAQAQANRDAHGLPILPLPYLILLKLRLSRTIDLGDLTRMLGLADDEALDQVREVVAEHAPEDSEDLEALIQLGKLETEGG